MTPKLMKQHVSLKVLEEIFSALSKRWTMDRTLNVLCSSNLSVSELGHAPSPLNSQLKSFFAKYFSHEAYYLVTKNSFPPSYPIVAYPPDRKTGLIINPMSYGLATTSGSH
jgi:hypothetical protein